MVRLQSNLIISRLSQQSIGCYQFFQKNSIDLRESQILNKQKRKDINKSFITSNFGRNSTKSIFDEIL